MQPPYPYTKFSDTASGWRSLFPVENRSSNIETISLSLQVTFPVWRSPELYRQRAVYIEKAIFLFASDAQDYERRIQRGLRAQSKLRADEAARQAAPANFVGMVDLFPDEPEDEEWFSTDQTLETLVFNGPPVAPSPPVQVCPDAGAVQNEEQAQNSLALSRQPYFTPTSNDDELWTSIQDFKSKFVQLPSIYEILVDILNGEVLAKKPMATTYNLEQCFRLLHLECRAQIPQGLTVEWVGRAARYLHSVVRAYAEKLLETIFHKHPEMTRDRKRLLAEFIQECVQG